MPEPREQESAPSMSGSALAQRALTRGVKPQLGPLGIIRRGVRGLRSALTSALACGMRERSHPIARREVEATRRISIVVPIHDALEVTALCLESLETYAHEAEIILIDDGSRAEETRSIIDDVVGRDQRFQLIRHETAKGHSRSSEAGVDRATREIICLLNSDAVITPYSWASVMDVFDAHPGAAIVGPMTSLASNAQQIDVAHRMRFSWTPSEINEFARRYTRAFSSTIVSRLLGSSTFPVYFVNGFAFFIRRAVWDELGGFPKELDDYGNETVLCRRAAQIGHELLVTRRSYVHHFGSQSYGAEGIETWKERRRRGRVVMDQLIEEGP